MADKSQAADRSEEFGWLYPELLSRDGLVGILKQRYVHQPDLETLEKEDLVELYNKYVIPLPQRKYRMNRRGREMTKKQIRFAKKRKTAGPDDGEPTKKKQIEDSVPNARFITSFEDPSKGENRLKPPPSCIDFKKKTIKLGSGSKPSSTTEENTSADETDLPSTKKKIKLISFPSSESNVITSTKVKSPTISTSVTSPTRKDNMNLNKTISLINKHLTAQATAATNKTSHTTDTSSPESKQAGKRDAGSSPQPEDCTDQESNEVPKSKKKIRIARIPWP